MAENLRRWGAGGIRRVNGDTPFQDILDIGITPKSEREIAPHPSLKPQKLMRTLAWISLPLGTGIILDPFAGGGSTIAAAEALGLESIGIELDLQYYEIAHDVIPRLAALQIDLPVDIKETEPLFVG